MTAKELNNAILESLDNKPSSITHESQRLIAKTLVKVCTDQAIVDPSNDDIARILEEISESIDSVVDDIIYDYVDKRTS